MCKGNPGKSTFHGKTRNSLRRNGKRRTVGRKKRLPAYSAIAIKGETLGGEYKNSVDSLAGGCENGVVGATRETRAARKKEATVRGVSFFPGGSRYRA